MAIEKTEHYQIDKPVSANKISDDVSVIRSAFDIIDKILHDFSQEFLRKMDKSDTFDIEAVNGLDVELEKKMPANRTFMLTELVDIIGASDAMNNYILTRGDAGFIFSSALAVLGRHRHNADDVDGLQGILNTLVSGPSSALDGEIVVFDGITGKHAKRSGETLASLMSNVASRDYVEDAIATSGGGSGGGGIYYDTKAQADASIEDIAPNTGVNIVNDGTNNGFYVRQGDILVKKSNATLRELTELDDLVRNSLIKNDVTPDPFIFTDKYNALLGKVLVDGALQFRRLQIGDDEASQEIRTEKGLVDILGVQMVRGGEDNGSISIVDNGGHVILHIGPSGVCFFGDRIHSNQLSSGNDSYGALLDVRGDEMSIMGTPIERAEGRGHAVVDKYGFVILYSGVYGNYHFYENSQPSDVKPSDNLFAPADVLGFHANTDIKACIDDGQSLSRGAQALPTISNIQPYLNITLAGGNKARFGADARYNATAFIPLIEETLSGEGETPLSGCLNSVVRRAIASGAQASDYVFFGASVGAGGRTVFQLSEDDANSWFMRKTRLITDAYNLAVSQSKSFSVWSVLWYQGENDYSVNSPDTQPNHYQARFLTALWYPLVAHIKKTTGQKFDPYVFSYQVAAHRRYNQDHMRIALAQWHMSRSLPMFCLVAPCYVFPVAADNLHLSATGSWLMGEYTGKAKYQTMVRRSGKFRPLEPVQVLWSDTQVRVKFYVPNGALNFDSSWVSQAENQGFGIRGPSDEFIADAITSVDITAGDEVTIGLRADLPQNLTLTYARGKPGHPAHSGPVTGARGNLRDSAGDYDRVQHPLTAEEFKLHNYCVMFEHNQINGF